LNMFGGDSNFNKLVRNLGPLPQKFLAASKHRNVGQILDKFTT